MLVRIFDIETVGLVPPAPGLGVCELAWSDVTLVGGSWHIAAPIGTLINPGCPIPPEASAVHGLTDTDVAGAPPFEAVLPRLWDGNPTALAGHNVTRFEKLWLPPQRFDDTDWVDSYLCAVRLGPDCKQHGLQYLRYFLKLDVDERLAEPRHRAGPDTHVNAALLVRMLAKYPVEKLIEISREPLLLPRVPLGKHRGMKFSEVPADWLQWCAHRAEAMDGDVKFAAATELRRRSANGQGEKVEAAL
jgi:exodeoxyribonuclease X